MALEPLSSQTSIEARMSAEQLLTWTDKDGDTAPDSATLTQGYQQATGIIFGYLLKRFGETELESWTIDTAPAQILRISDALCIGIFSSGNYAQSEKCKQISLDAINELKALRAGDMDLYGVIRGITTTSATEEPDDPFEDIIYYNE